MQQLSETSHPQSLKSLQTAQTRSRILRSAIDLFNERGAFSVTTHDIANAAGMSPGNLYYHFKNKEQIIREVFNQMEIFSENQWSDRGPRNPKVGILDFMRFFMGNLRKYRFFFREFSRLMQDDPILANQWRQNYQRLFEVMQGAVYLWIEAGILKKFGSSEEINSFIDNCWVVLTFSSIYLEAKNGPPSKENDEKSEKLFLRFLYPYHTFKGQKALDL